MSQTVCLVCDRMKLPDYRRSRNVTKSWCQFCLKETIDREVADDHLPIAPQSALTFEQQRRIFEQERKRA